MFTVRSWKVESISNLQLVICNYRGCAMGRGAAVLRGVAVVAGAAGRGATVPAGAGWRTAGAVAIGVAAGVGIGVTAGALAAGAEGTSGLRRVSTAGASPAGTSERGAKPLSAGGA